MKLRSLALATVAALAALSSSAIAEQRSAPYHAPRRRLDETRAARSPVLRWTPPKPLPLAAE